MQNMFHCKCLDIPVFVEYSLIRPPTDIKEMCCSSTIVSLYKYFLLLCVSDN